MRHLTTSSMSRRSFLAALDSDLAATGGSWLLPPGTSGEYLTGTLPKDGAGIPGPVGQGFRVLMLVISPWSRGEGAQRGF